MIEFTLPVTATNIMLQYHTMNVAKSFSGKEHREREREKERSLVKHGKGASKERQNKGKGSKVESVNQIKGIDTVLMILPKNVAAKLGVVGGQDSSKGG